MAACTGHGLREVHIRWLSLAMDTEEAILTIWTMDDILQSMELRAMFSISAEAATKVKAQTWI